MEPGPPDTKRPRLTPWSATTPQGVSLPLPHSTSQHPHPHPHPHAHHPHPHPASAPPPPHSHSIHHPPVPAYQPYPPRTTEHSSAPATPVVSGPAPQPHSDSDRRHHDQEPYPPMQEHYRQQQPPPPPPLSMQQPPQQQHHHHLQQQLPPPPPPPSHAQHPPSPANPPYQPYPPRESAIKREPADDPRRPNSTGHAPESLPPTPHPLAPPHQPAHPPPPPGTSAHYPDTQPRHMGYDGGSHAPPTPGGFRAPSYPPTPISHQPTYEQQQPHPSYQSAPEPFYSVYASTVASKKKNTRASQACDQCRQLKAKCDETKPCKTCRDKGTECRYRDPVPKATDKAQADILDGIADMKSTLATLVEHMGNMDGRIGNMNDRLKKIETTFPGDSRGPHPKPEPLGDEVKSAATEGSYQSAQDGSGDQYYGDNVRRNPVITMPEDEFEPEPGPPVPPGEPAIPINHTTLASLLLDWPSIRDLAGRHVESAGVRYISEYPISIEQNRGFLIVHGRGEDSYRFRQAPQLPDHGMLDLPDDASDAASPSPAADYGQLGGFSPPDQIEYKGGVLGVDGNPDFTPSKVWAYVESFKNNILNMHPIVQPHVLDSWVHQFLDQLPVAQPRSVKPQASRPAFAVGGGAQTPTEMVGAKRKRSPGPDGPDGPSTPAPAKAGRPNRSIHSAIVLTVLALGKVCLYRDGIPDVVHPPESTSYGSPLTRNGIPPSPNQGSPPGFSAHSHSSGLTSPKEQERGLHSRRSSIHGPGGVRAGYQLKKNYEVIPGLEYFAYATDILGNHTGAYNNMKDIYANLFAGLYLGQLARPMESFAYIHKASHKLQVIMRPSLDRLRQYKMQSKLIEVKRDNELALTFWTCLQLESDLIAELPLPPSGLLSYEEDMPYPNMVMLHGFDHRILDSYPGQLYLRTHLNSIHRMFYAPDDPKAPAAGQDKFKNVGLVSDAVSGMNWVARSFAFKEDDPPATDILSARLRAKYWGAQVITYRPFIRQILQFSHTMQNNSSTSPEIHPVSEFRQDIIAPVIHPSARNPGDIDPQVVEYAKKGIKALIESTRAFHGLDERRPIITNIFGTAHAQWGNLLVLSAVFRDPILHAEIDEELLRTLFHKTVMFFRQSVTATSSLRTDLHILEGLQRDLFPVVDARTNSSFSSSTSTLTPKLPMAAPPPHVKTPYPQ